MSRWRLAWAVGALAAALVGGAAGGVLARCRSVDDCSRGVCVPVEECDSALDPPAGPPPPGSAPPSRSLVPQRRPGTAAPRLVPPQGTSQCRPAYVCVAGRCAWETICN